MLFIRGNAMSGAPSIRAGERNSSHLRNVQTGPGPIKPRTQSVPEVHSVWVKWLGREADHSPSSKASVKLSEIVHSGPHALLWRVFKNKKLPM